VLGGRYRIVRVLGAGGMGVVYRGEHVHMHKPVALKILHKHMTSMPEIVARFEREAVAAGRIQHPNVAAATDFGKLEDGSFYLALEYVEGQSLGSLIRKNPLDPLRALVIARQIAEGLGAAHAAGIVHRDLKPDNVQLVSREGITDWVKILDFGIAKLHIDEGVGNQPLTQIGSVFGTPEYMSPEQAQGHPVDHRADLYALGVILFEMLSGKIPFDADDVVVLITRHVTQEVPPLPDSVPPRIQALVRALLEKKPEQRLQTAAEVVAKIDELFADPSIAPPGSIPPRPSSLSPPRSGGANRSRGAGLGQSLARVSAAMAPALERVSAIVRKSAHTFGPWASQEVKLGRLVTARGWMLAGAAGLMLVGVLIAVLLAGPSEKPVPSASAEPSAGPPPSAAPPGRDPGLVKRAESGEEDALRSLEEARGRTLEETRALGRGRCQRGEMVACMNAYKDGMQEFSRLRKDDIVLADVRSAAVHPLAYEAAMRLAAHQLGAGGLDVLWDTWVATKKDSERAAINRRARAFLDDTAVRNNASRELALVLDLERAERRRRCSEAKKLLASAAEYGDVRVIPLLDRFSSTRGCGLLDLQDCWGCLRGDKALALAREVASTRPGPTFVLP
jgi:serine/threonine-protein kinase